MFSFSGIFQINDFLIKTGEYYTVRIEIVQQENRISGVYQAINKTNGCLLFPNLPDIHTCNFTSEIREGATVFNITADTQLLLIPVYNDSDKIGMSIYKREAVFTDKIILERLSRQESVNTFSLPSLTHEQVIAYCKSNIRQCFRNGNSFVTRHHGEHTIMQQQGILFKQSLRKIVAFNATPPAQNVFKDVDALLKFLYGKFIDDAKENGWETEVEVWEFIKNYFQNKSISRDLAYQERGKQFAVFYKKEVLELFKAGRVCVFKKDRGEECWQYLTENATWQRITTEHDVRIFSSELEFLNALFEEYKNDSLKGGYQNASWAALKSRVINYINTN